MWVKHLNQIESQFNDEYDTFSAHLNNDQHVLSGIDCRAISEIDRTIQLLIMKTVDLNDPDYSTQYAVCIVGDLSRFFVSCCARSCFIDVLDLLLSVLVKECDDDVSVTPDKVKVFTQINTLQTVCGGIPAIWCTLVRHVTSHAAVLSVPVFQRWHGIFFRWHVSVRK